MAGSDNGLSSRTIPEDQNEEDSDDYQLMFKHFKENKVEIASAITKPFPFLMSLRDRDFISEKKFQEYQETCRNLVPVDRVVYDILSDVQKKFSRDLLKVIFSKTHLKAYPDLKETLKQFFLNVSDSHRTHQRMNGRNVEEMPRLPSVVREASCSPGNSKTNEKQAEEVPSLPQCNGGGEPSLPQCNGGEGISSCEQMHDGQEPQDDLSSSLRPEAASCSPGNSKTNDDQSKEMLPLPQCNGGEGINSCEQTSDGQEPQDDLPSSLRQEAGAKQPTSEKKCSCVMCSPTYMPEDLEARMGSSQGEVMGTRRNVPARKPKKQRRKKKGHNWSKPKRRKPMSVQRKRGRIAVGQAAFKRKKMKKNPGLTAKIRGLRRRRKENANFSAELLPVTCGDLKGVLHKDKFKQGISVMSIQCQDGNWFTPTEFEIMGGHGRSKNWKLSLRCHNWPLKFLIQRNFLPNPPRTYGKRKKMGAHHQKTQNLHQSPDDHSIQNSDECEVCRDGGTLFCCDTCSKAFHEECHIPTVEAEITPWSCIFCRMQSLGSQPSLPESEVLQREMVPQEQLKCEYVLLRVYCCSESSFFSKMPYYYYFREMTVGVQEPMWLDIIKKKLSDQAYCQVEDFVHDMRLIFRNHRITFKDPKFGEMGLRLESKFEKSFKEVFAIQETNKKS